MPVGLLEPVLVGVSAVVSGVLESVGRLTGVCVLLAVDLN